MQGGLGGLFITLEDPYSIIDGYTDTYIDEINQRKLYHGGDISIN